MQCSKGSFETAAEEVMLWLELVESLEAGDTSLGQL